MTDSTKVAPVSHHSEFLGVLGYIFIALVLLSTILRFWSRALLVEKKFQADDWTALAAGVSPCKRLNCPLHIKVGTSMGKKKWLTSVFLDP